MPTTNVVNSKNDYQNFNKHTLGKKNYTQTVSIAVGCVMIVIGLAGILNDEFMGMHLSAMHSLVLASSGALAVWAATLRKTRKAFYVDLVLGIFFALNAIAGFMLGSEGVPGVGYESQDQFLIKYMPGFIELGFVDHIVHSVLAVFFLSGAFSWKLHHKSAGDSKRA